LLIEIICSYTQINDKVYRLLCLRYIFLIYLGYEWAKRGVLLNGKTLTAAAISIAFILIFQYTDWNLEPLFFHHIGWKIYHWITYFYVATLFVFILRLFYNRQSKRINNILLQMGRYSYEIYLLQMLVSSFVSVDLFEKLLMPIVGVKPLMLIFYYLSVISLSIVPVLAYYKIKIKYSLRRYANIEDNKE